MRRDTPEPPTSEDLAADVAAWLAKGNEIEQVPITARADKTTEHARVLPNGSVINMTPRHRRRPT